MIRDRPWNLTGGDARPRFYTETPPVLVFAGVRSAEVGPIWPHPIPGQFESPAVRQPSAPKSPRAESEITRDFGPKVQPEDRKHCYLVPLPVCQWHCTVVLDPSR
jgi:hypothetical protein